MSTNGAGYRLSLTESWDGKKNDDPDLFQTLRSISLVFCSSIAVLKSFFCVSHVELKRDFDCLGREIAYLCEALHTCEQVLTHVRGKLTGYSRGLVCVVES